MADNVVADPGVGGATLAADDISSVFYPRGKLSLGADGTAVDAVGGTGVDSTGVMRVSLATDIALPAGTNEIGKLAAGTAEIGKLAAGVAEIGNVKNSGTFAVQSTLQAGTAEFGKLAAGTASIGVLGANSGVDIGDVDILSQPARVATTDGVGAALDTASIMNGTTALTPKFAAISGATSGDNTLVAAVAAKKIRVLSLTVVAAGAVDFRLEDGAAGTALTGVMSLTTNSGFTLPFSPVGHTEGGSNTLLNMELSAAVQVSGLLTYIEV